MRRHDVEVLLAKQRSGADFAITQVFFHTEQYADLLTRARRAGVTIPIIPGVMPLTSLRRLTRLGELTGVEPAPELIERLAAAEPTPNAPGSGSAPPWTWPTRPWTPAPPVCTSTPSTNTRPPWMCWTNWPWPVLEEATGTAATGTRGTRGRRGSRRQLAS